MDVLKQNTKNAMWLHLGICGDVMVNSRQLSSPTLLFLTRRLLAEQPS